ncbi:hypothetical protein COOONC_12645 [Cooperia oncophora]
MKRNSSSASKFLTLFDSLLARAEILDLVFSVQDSISHIYAMPPLSTSDHTTVAFTMPTIIRDERPTLIRDFKLANKDVIAYHLSRMNWYEIFDNYQSIDELYGRFCDIITTLSIHSYPAHIRNLLQQRERLFFQISHPVKSAVYQKINKYLDRHLKRFQAHGIKKLRGTRNLKQLPAQIKTFINNAPVEQVPEGLDGKNIYHPERERRSFG